MYGVSELQEATAKYQEVVKSVQDDPRLLSLLGKRRGQKGFRELQGDALRQCCSKIQTYLVRTSSLTLLHGYHIAVYLYLMLVSY